MDSATQPQQEEMNLRNDILLYPNVTSLPSQSGVERSERQPNKTEGSQGEFHKIFEKNLEYTEPSLDLDQIKVPLKFSAHAFQRLQDRKIPMDQALMSKINAAVDKASQKGVEDTLVLTGDAAFIVNVKNRTVVTAMDRNSLNGNVFTNIDGAIMV